MLKAKVNHVILCLNIMWKSSGCLLIKCDFDLVSELNCDNSRQINFVIIKSQTDFFPIYF